MGASISPAYSAKLPRCNKQCHCHKLILAIVPFEEKQAVRCCDKIIRRTTRIRWKFGSFTPSTGHAECHWTHSSKEEPSAEHYSSFASPHRRRFPRSLRWDPWLIFASTSTSFGIGCCVFWFLVGVLLWNAAAASFVKPPYLRLARADKTCLPTQTQPTVLLQGCWHAVYTR